MRTDRRINQRGVKAQLAIIFAEADRSGSPRPDDRPARHNLIAMDGWIDAWRPLECQAANGIERRGINKPIKGLPNANPSLPYFWHILMQSVGGLPKHSSAPFIMLLFNPSLPLFRSHSVRP